MPDSMITTLESPFDNPRGLSGVIVLTGRYRKAVDSIFDSSPETLGKGGWFFNQSTDSVEAEPTAEYTAGGGENYSAAEAQQVAYNASLPSIPVKVAPARHRVVNQAAIYAAEDAAQIPGQAPSALVNIVRASNKSSDADTANAAGLPLMRDFPGEFHGVIVGPPRRRSDAPTAHVQALAAHAVEACENDAELSLAGPSLERLATLCLSRKLADSSPVGPAERRQMLRDAGVPGALYANPATESIFSSSAENLGKGGVIGSISKAVSKVTQQVSRVVAPVTKIVNAVGSGVSGVVTSTVSTLAGTVENLNQDFETGVSKLGNMAAQNPGAVVGALASGGASLGDIGLGESGGAGGGSEYGSEEYPATPTTSPTNVGGIILVGGGVLGGLWILSKIFSGRRRRR